MEVTAGVVIPVTEPSRVGEARRRGAEFGVAAGFDETTLGRLALVLTEAATNLVKHGRDGQLFVGPAGGRAHRGVQVIAIDHGPGMASIGASLRDGYSTAGTPGTGLGAIARASSSFDVYSVPAQGTALAATVYSNGVPAASVGAVSVPMRGEQECGDGWATWSAGQLTSVFVCDGLGHGRDAAIAARAAVAAFRQHAERPAAQVISMVFDALRSTRGAAVAVAELDARDGRATYCGLGNIAGVIAAPGQRARHLVSHSGIAGHTRCRFQEFQYDWPDGSLLVMHTDGISGSWDLDAYAGLSVRQPDIIAGVLYRDWNRGRDDATVVVTRNGAVR
jgi:anti-sigma regulatory factor (Ser/Thr protein kinase)